MKFYLVKNGMQQLGH